MSEKDNPLRVEKPKMVKIMLEENDQIPPTGLFISGTKDWVLRPGEEVDVPEEIVGILKDAVYDAPVFNSAQQVVGYRPRMRFPFRRVD